MARRFAPDRRMLLQAASAVAVAAAFAPLPAGAQTAAATRFRGVAVDTRPLASIGGGASAELIQRIMPGKLASAFADLIDPRDARAPTLVARIDHLFLSSFADAPAVGFGSLSQLDSLEGAGLVVAGRQVLSTTPLRVTLPAGYSGAYYLPDIDARRIDSICQQFASWLRKEMNL